MRKAIVIATGLVALTAGSAAKADQKADQKFCAAAATFDSDAAELKAIGPHSTMAELRAATDRVEKSATAMQKAAAKIKTPTAKEFDASMKQLKQDVDKVPDDATLEQVRSKIKTDVQGTQSTGQQLATESGCPQPTPQQEPQQP
jgi:hypothetical protein